MLFKMGRLQIKLVIFSVMDKRTSSLCKGLFTRPISEADLFRIRLEHFFIIQLFSFHKKAQTKP